MSDTHNPYTPPKAEVFAGSDANAELPASRPTAVNIAIFLLVVEILLSVTATISALNKDSWDEGPAIILGLGALDISITSLLCVFVARGRNWARIVLLVLWMLSLSGLLFGLSMAFLGELPAGTAFDTTWTNLVWLATPHLLSLTIVILLFGPGRSWFSKRKTE